MSQPIPFPLSKNQLLLAVDKLPYTQRIKYASRLGHDHKANPNLRALVNDLLKHPEAPAPEMEAEEGFTEILPAQRTTISKHYNEDQLALNIAAAAGMFDVIKERLNSPSTFFDKLVISNFVTMKEEPMKVDKGKKSAPKYRASDAEVSKAILDAVPARRHILIQESIQEKRFGVIALAVPLLEALPAYPEEKIAHIMHACTSERVRKFIRANLYKNVGQNMKKIIKFHHQDVFDVLEMDLEATNSFQRSYIYDVWRGWINVPLASNIKNKDIQKRILDLVEKYPPCTWYGRHDEAKTEEPGLYSQDIPHLMKVLLESLYADFPERTYKLIIRTVFVHKRQSQVYGDVDAFWNLAHTSHQHQIQFIQHMIAQKEHIKDWAKYFFTNNTHVDHRVLTNIVPNAMNTKNWNTHHQQKVLRILVDLYNSTKTNNRNYEDRWWMAWESLLDNTLSFFDRKFTTARSVLGSNSGKKEEDAKKHEKAKKDIAKYRKAVFGSIYLLYSTILNKSLEEVKHEKDYPLREANINLDIGNRYYNKISSDPVILAKSFERMKPHLNTILERVRTQPPTYPTRVSSFLTNVLTRVKPARNAEDASYTKEDRDVADKLFVDIFKYIRSYNEEAFKKDTSLIAQLLGRCDVDLTFEHFFPILAKDPLAYTNFFRGNYGLLSLEQKKAVFKYYNLDAFIHLAQTDYQYLSVLIEPLPLELTNEAVNHLLQTPKAVEESARRVLLPLQDVSDHKIRSSLQKMANANSTAERNEALSALVSCTKRTHNLTQLTRTLTFICDKIKNESHTNRAEILGYLTPGGREFLIPEGVGETQFAKWFEMLDDALQSPSLDEDVYDRTNFDLHPILQHFHKLANEFCIVAAIEDGAKLLGSGLLEFGAEILWRLTVFRHGEKKAAAQYKIPFQGYNFLGTETIQNSVEPLRKVIAAYMKIYEAKITEKNPEWKADFEYYQPFFSISTTYWPFIPEIVDIIHVQVVRIKSEAEKDDDGLYIIENDDAILPIVNAISTLPLEHWSQAPAVELIDTLMHSRQAPSILPKWVAWKESGAKLAREFKDAKDKYIDELLKITPSAIHLRFVWRHLLTYNQSKLDNYIGKKKTFRGVFYVDADKRKFIRSALKTPETRRAGGRERSKKGVPARGGRGGARGGRTRATRAGLIYEKPSDIKKSVEEERTKEKEMLEELEKMPAELRDHEDFFVLEACYGLYRLLPRQVNALAQDWFVQVLNADRSLPYRVKATARWTIMPTITYNDVVVFMNDYENGKEGKTKPLSVNVIETLLRGVMRNDEPCAPLNFLLSPKFLASDRSRVSVYAISQCVPYMPAGGLTEMLKLCLSGKRRYQLKISAYKEIIRLLTSTPSTEHLNMIFREWKREDQHRDVCIAILQNVVKFLTSKNEKFLDISWKILESAPTHEKPEILMAVLGPTPQGRSAMTLPDSCLHTKNLGEPYNQTTSLLIPTEHCARFGSKVVIPIAKTAKNDDVQWTALWRLESWNVPDEAVPLLHNYLKDLSTTTLLYSGNVHENNIFTARWEALCNHFIQITITYGRHVVQPVLDLANTLVNRILELTNKDRDVRIRMLALARHMENKIPETSYLNSLTPEEHKQLRAPFVKLGFKIFNRRSAEIGYRTETLKQNTANEVLALIHDIIEYYSVNATETNAAVDLVSNTLNQNNTIWSEIIPKMVDLQIDVNKSPVSTTPEYLYLLRRVALNAINRNANFIISYPMQTLNFWEKLYDFAAERKDIPREHLKCSQIFSHHTLCESIQKTIHQCRISHTREYRLEYLQAAKQVLSTVAQRYLSVLKGEKGDSFAQVVGDYIIRNYSLFFVENPESDTKWREIAHYVIKTTEDSISIIPKVVRALINFDQSAGINFIQEILELSLAHRFEKEKPSDEYVRRSRVIGMEAIAIHTPFAYEKIEVVAKFLEQVTPILPTLDRYAPRDNTAERSQQVTRLVKTACTHTVKDRDVIPRAAKIMIDTYLPKYIDGPKEWEGSAFGPEQRVAREVVYYLISERTNWIVQNYLKFIPNLVNFIMLEATNKLLEKNQAISYITTLTGKYYDKNSVHMWKEVYSLISDVIHMRLSGKPKDKKYVELTFDLVHDLITQNISFVIKRREDFLHYLNWAVSWYVREPDVVELKNNLYSILTNSYLIPINDDEESIAEVAALIHELIDLKHQKFVLPQQTLLPLQSYPQYTHISLVLALGMTNKFGEKTRLTKEKHYVWREEFILLIDRLSDVKDPIVRLSAWSTETVHAK